MTDREGGGFGRAIAVDQSLRAAFGEHFPDPLRVERVAADEQVLKTGEGRRVDRGQLIE